MPKEIVIIAVPNGAGKTTFARSYFKHVCDINLFVNADLIAAGLSPFAPEREAIQAGRLMVKQIEKLVKAEESFLIETTLSSNNYAIKIPYWQSLGYVVTLIFLSLNSEELALRRVATRVKEGGHNVPASDIRRRFRRGLSNYKETYRELVNRYVFLDNSPRTPKIIEYGENYGR